MVCHYAANGLFIMLRSPTKLVTNIPPGVGADSSRPYPNIIKYTYSHNRIRAFTLSHTHFRLPFCGCIHIRGHDKSVPYGCLWFAITLRTDCQNVTNGLLKQFKRITITMQTGYRNAADDYKKQKRHVAKTTYLP